MNTIAYPTVQTVLNKLHREASREMGKIAKGLAKAIFRPLKPEDMKDTYIAISRDAGEYIHDLLIKKGSKNIVEFGTSFGISTLYLGAAAKANGGQVITSEILAEKCRIAQRNFDDAGLSDFIDLREGDAMKTLADVPDEIDFLLLDGWNDLYLPLLKMLEPKFKKGTLIYTDNADFNSSKPLLDYFKNAPEQYRNYTIGFGAALTEVV